MKLRFIIVLVLFSAQINCAAVSSAEDRSEKLSLSQKEKLNLKLIDTFFTKYSYDAVKNLIEQGADLNFTYGNSSKLLIYALANMDYDIVELLLKNGATQENYVLFGKKTTVLHYILATARVHKVEKLKLLLKYGADINAVDEDGNTALHFELRYNSDFQIVDLLLDHGARTEVKNKELRTPWQLAKDQFNKIFNSNYEEIMEQINGLRSDGVVNFDGRGTRFRCALEIETLQNKIKDLKKVGKLAVENLVDQNMPVEVAQIVESYMIDLSEEEIASRRKRN